MKRIKLKIGLSGENLCKITLEGEGFEGTECIKTMDELQDILGLQTVEQEDKPEIVLRDTSINIENKN